MMKSITFYKQRQIENKSLKNAIKKQQTDALYLRIEEIEQPLERILKLNMDLGLMTLCLDDEKKLLQSKLDSGKYLYYDDLNRKKLE